MGGVALVESVSTDGKATNLTGHLYSGYEAKDYNLVGNKLLRKRAAAAMLDIHTRATLSRTRGSLFEVDFDGKGERV
jgi:hypothetical protein